MKKLFCALTLAALVVMGACTGGSAGSAVQTDIPHLEKRGNVTQMIVGGKPFLALSGELRNSSSSSPEYMRPIWPKLREAGLNSVIAVLTWEQIEPVEGQFEFGVVDQLIADARANDLKLIFIWMGSWKNGITSYDPVWVKNNPERYQLALTREGKRLPILSTQCAAARDADAKAYGALMAHIRDVDRDQTVIMMQIENEVGLHGYTRDYHPDAVRAFEGPVPAELISYLDSHFDNLLPETRNAWVAAGRKKSGSWEEVFGVGDYTDELFMAWSYASYIGKIAAAGKAEYPIPTYVNAWIVQPEDLHPGNYPSGGPQAQNHDMWRAAAPGIDILSPDIYLNDYPGIIRMYSRCGNPVFIPESRGGQGGAANAAFTFGEMGGIGYSPFGIDSQVDSPANQDLYNFYRLAGSAADEILAAQAEGRICGAWLKGSDPAVYKEERVMGDWRICFELVSSGRRNGGAPQVTGGTYNPSSIGYGIAIQEENGFLILGSNVRVYFYPADGVGTAGLAKVTEGRFENGEWHEGRWLNGDEIQLRYDLLYAIEDGVSGQGLNFGTPTPGLIKVELFKY
ncbi:MAG: DUF5597 domain-containing protein [Bacteroidales bacterium]|nr:DUF5597 domain-containing protein [Bacteroidales bacterium]